jgi:hypothetical protein
MAPRERFELPTNGFIHVPALGAAPHQRARPAPSHSCTFASQLKQSATLNWRYLPTKMGGQSESRAAASHHEADVLVSSRPLAASTNIGCSVLICDEGIDTDWNAAWYASASSTRVRFRGFSRRYGRQTAVAAYQALVANAVAVQRVVDQTQAPHAVKSELARISRTHLALQSPTRSSTSRGASCISS